jgi:hypothetical protein
MRRWRLVLIAYAAAVLLVAAAAIQSARKQLPITFFFSDVATTANLPFYAGIVSNVGILLWTVAAVAACFAGSVLRLRGGDPRLARFLLASGAFSALLMADDLFLVHEMVAPYYLGIPQNVVLGSYGVLAMAGFAAFNDTIRRTEYQLFALAVAFLALSVAIDLASALVPNEVLWEDSTKLLGIVAWCLYFTRTAFVGVMRI